MNPRQAVVSLGVRCRYMVSSEVSTARAWRPGDLLKPVSQGSNPAGALTAETTPGHRDESGAFLAARVRFHNMAEILATARWFALTPS